MVEFLLQNGGDPALYDAQGMTPKNVAPADTRCEALLVEWTTDETKIAETERLKVELRGRIKAAGEARAGGGSGRAELEKEMAEVSEQIGQEEENLKQLRSESALSYKQWVDGVMAKLVRGEQRPGSVAAADGSVLVEKSVGAGGSEAVALSTLVQQRAAWRRGGASLPTQSGRSSSTVPSSTRTSAAISDQEEQRLLRDLALKLRDTRTALEQAVGRVEELQLKHEELKQSLSGDPDEDGRGPARANFSVVPFSKLADALLRDAGPFAINKDHDKDWRDTRFPFVWDTSGKAAVFFDYMWSG